MDNGVLSGPKKLFENKNNKRNEVMKQPTNEEYFLFIPIIQAVTTTTKQTTRKTPNATRRIHAEFDAEAADQPRETKKSDAEPSTESCPCQGNFF